MEFREFLKTIAPPSGARVDDRRSAILAIAFTDIAGSTELRERLGEHAYERLREDHDAEVRLLAAQEGAGAFVKSTGDGALLVFYDVSAAVERLCAFQETLMNDPHFRLRIGIDMGQVTVRQHEGGGFDVFGRHVNRAARIQAKAQPGHVLTSGVVFDSAENWLRGSGISWANLGQVALKGFSGEISLMEPYRAGSWEPQAVEQQDESNNAEVGTAYNIGIDEAAMRWRKLGGPAREVPREAISPEQTLSKRIRPVEVIPAGDPYEHWAQRISKAAGDFERRHGRRVRLYWLDDFPANNRRLVALLTEAGVSVSTLLNDALLEAELNRAMPDVLITDMGRGEQPDAGLSTLRRLQGRGVVWPRMVFSTGRAIGAFGRESYAAGASLVTSGGLSVLSGVEQVVRRYLKIPKGAI